MSFLQEVDLNCSHGNFIFGKPWKRTFTSQHGVYLLIFFQLFIHEANFPVYSNGPIVGNKGFLGIPLDVAINIKCS